MLYNLLGAFMDTHPCRVGLGPCSSPLSNRFLLQGPWLSTVCPPLTGASAAAGPGPPAHGTAWNGCCASRSLAVLRSVVSCFLAVPCVSLHPQLDPRASESSRRVLSIPPALGAELGARRSSFLRLNISSLETHTFISAFFHSFSKSVFRLAAAPGKTCQVSPDLSPLSYV